MNNSQPHSSFFREKKPEKQKALIREKNIKSLMLFAISAAYVLFAIFIIKIDARGYQGITVLASYAYGVIGGFVFLYLKQRYTDTDRSRRILTEVLEKSAEARAITDPEGDTIYSNLRFNNLVGEKEPPSLVSFCRIFDNPQKIEKALNELRIRSAPDGSATTEFQTRMGNQPLWFQVTCQPIARGKTCIRPLCPHTFYGERPWRMKIKKKTVSVV